MTCRRHLPNATSPGTPSATPSAPFNLSRSPSSSRSARQTAGRPPCVPNSGRQCFPVSPGQHGTAAAPKRQPSAAELQGASPSERGQAGPCERIPWQVDPDPDGVGLAGLGGAGGAMGRDRVGYPQTTSDQAPKVLEPVLVAHPVPQAEVDQDLTPRPRGWPRWPPCLP